MKTIKEEALVWIRLVCFIAIWIFVLLISGEQLIIDADAVKKLPEVVTAYIIISFIGVNWLWKIPWLQGWLIQIPNLQGTWEGEIKSTEVDPATGNPLLPIRVVLVIRQSFTKISCVMFSKESESYSTTAQINEDDSCGVLRLTYNYINRPRAGVISRSPIHDGATILKIIRIPVPLLEGFYWTSRKTTGEINLKFKTRKLYEKFFE